MKKFTRKFYLATALASTLLLLAGCGTSKQNTKNTFIYGTTAYGKNHDNGGLNPHKNYQGWSTLRYGVGETLFRFNDAMQPECWLAENYKIVDDYTVVINLKANIKFSSGRTLDAAAVKECLEALLAKHPRAAYDLHITNIQAEGQKLTLSSSQKVTVLVNYLCDPYTCIMDMQSSQDGNKLAGTGPYIMQKVTGNELQLKSNENYWQGKPHVENIIVKGIPDGDTLTLALQNGEIDAAQGLPYASLKLFANDKYKKSSVFTSRVFQGAFNFHNPALQDVRVRQAISQVINREAFTEKLLLGNGKPAVSAFPDNLPFGGDKLHTTHLEQTKIKALLAEAGYRDTNGDGYVDKDGKNLTLRWLTYASRQELPLLAEAAQAYLKNIGIKVDINITDNITDFLKRDEWDIYAKAFVTAPTGDAQYYFVNHVLQDAPINHGHYANAEVTELVNELRNEFNIKKRAALALQLSQKVADDYAFMYFSHLQMNLLMKPNISGFTAHPCDYYEITHQLRKE